MNKKSDRNKKKPTLVQSKKQAIDHPTRKKFFFYTILILLPFLLFTLLEFSLRIFSYGDDLRLFVQSSNPNYLTCNRIVSKRYFSKFDYTVPINDFFLKNKPGNGYRIFVLGGSTVQGFPYKANLVFTRILQRRLQDIFTNRKIEVINLGLTAVNSYTLLDFADEILQQKPDAILIYAGHNEYYGALGVASMENGSIPGWMKKLHLSLIHFRTYQLLQNFINSITKIIHPISSDEAKRTLMQQIAGKNVIPYNSEMYKDGLIQFRENLSDLLAEFKNAQVPVIISDLVCNIKDLPPFLSLDDGKNKDEFADSVYYEARELEAKSLFEQAKEKYTKAKDLDAIRFRASEDINKIIHELADKYDDYFISLKSLFEKYSPHGLVGNNLMTEHLHPNIEGCFLMSEGFFDALKGHNMIGNNRDSTRIKPWTYYMHNWGYTRLDSMIGVLGIKHLKAGWPFKPENTINNFKFTYQPNGIVDSLAFSTIKYNDVSFEKVHKDLAEYYNLNEDLKSASKEYLALAYAFPMNASYFYYAAEYANKAKDYDNAIRILNESLNPDSSIYVNYTIASIYFSEKNYDAALTSLSKLKKLRLNKKNYLLSEKLKYKIQKASQMDDEAEKTLAGIKILEPGFDPSRESKKSVVLIPGKIKPYIEKAERLRKEGKISESLVVLTEANKILETAYANLLIGKLLLNRNNVTALKYFEKAEREIKDDPSLIFNLCILYLIKKDLPGAKNKINEFVKLEGENNPRSLQLKELYRKTIEEKNKK